MKLTDNEKRDIIKPFPLMQEIETMNDWQLVDELPQFSGDLLGGALLPIKIALKK